MYHNLFKYKSPIDTHTSDTPKTFLLQRKLQLTSLYTYHCKCVVELPSIYSQLLPYQQYPAFLSEEDSPLYLQGLVLIDISHITKSEVYLCLRASLVAQTVKRLPAMWGTRVQFPGWEDPLEKEMAAHSNIFAWEIPWTEESGGLQSMGSQNSQT